MERTKIVRLIVPIHKLPHDCWWKIIIFIDDWSDVVDTMICIEGLYDYICFTAKYGSDTQSFALREIPPPKTDHGYPFVRCLTFCPLRVLKTCSCLDCSENKETPNDNNDSGEGSVWNENSYYDSSVSYESFFREILNYVTRFRYLKILRLDFFFINPITTVTPKYETIKLGLFPNLVEVEIKPFPSPRWSICKPPLGNRDFNDFPTCIDFGRESNMEVIIILGKFGSRSSELTNKAVKLMNFPISTVKKVKIRDIKLVDCRLFYNENDKKNVEWKFPSLRVLHIHDSNFLYFMIPTNIVSSANFPKLFDIAFSQTKFAKEKSFLQHDLSFEKQNVDLVFSNLNLDSLTLSYPPLPLFDWNSIVIQDHLEYHGSIIDFTKSFYDQRTLQITDTVKMIRFLNIRFTNYIVSSFQSDLNLISNFEFLERLELRRFNNYPQYYRQNTFSVSECPKLREFVVRRCGIGSMIDIFNCKSLRKMVIFFQHFSNDISHADHLRITKKDTPSLKEVEISRLEICPIGNFWNTVENLDIRSCGCDFFRHFDRVFDFSKIGMNVMKKVVLEMIECQSNHNLWKYMVKEFKNVPPTLQEFVIKWDATFNFGNIGVKSLETLLPSENERVKGINVKIEVFGKAYLRTSSEDRVEKVCIEDRREVYSGNEKKEYVEAFKKMSSKEYRTEMLYGKKK